jgi:hypothetical protein
MAGAFKMDICPFHSKMPDVRAAPVFYCLYIPDKADKAPIFLSGGEPFQFYFNHYEVSPSVVNASLGQVT